MTIKAGQIWEWHGPSLIDVDTRIPLDPGDKLIILNPDYDKAMHHIWWCLAQQGRRVRVFHDEFIRGDCILVGDVP